MMKSIISIGCLALLTFRGIPAHAQWTQINLNPSLNLLNVQFVNTGAGCINTSKTILKTGNGALSWDTLYYNPNDNISDVQFFNDSTIFFSGYYNTSGQFLKKTFDFGNNWVTINSGTGSNIFFTSLTTGFTDVPFGVFKTTDGGINWTACSGNPGSGAPGNIFFINDSIGYVASSYPGKIDKTNDGGATWQSQPAIEAMNIFVSSPDTAYAAGYSGSIVKTTNGGANWVQQSSALPGSIVLRSVFCSANNTCYAVGDSGTIIRTTDGGLNWEKQISGTTQKLYAVCCTDNNTCYVVGDSGVVLKTANGGVGLNKNFKKKVK